MKRFALMLSAVSMLALVAGCGGCCGGGKKEKKHKDVSHKVVKKSKKMEHHGNGY